MRRLTLQELSQSADTYDAAVASMQDIDHFCSSTDWVLPAAQALMPAREPWIFESDGCFWAFMRGRHAGGFYYLEPLEAMWALACPIVGRDHERLVQGLLELCAMPSEAWTILALSGLPTAHPLFAAIVSGLASELKLGLGVSTARLVVDLDGGADAFLGRRSKHFRRSLQRSQRKAAAQGITFAAADGQAPEALFERIMAVESRGWKGQDGVGITEGVMHDFYQLMMPRLCRRGAHRLLFARHAGRDVAYIFGGLCMDGYRGLQFSFDQEYRAYGLGNLLQLEQIVRLCEEGVQTYDLGMHMDYKLRWADRERETVTLLLMRQAAAGSAR